MAKTDEGLLLRIWDRIFDFWMDFVENSHPAMLAAKAVSADSQSRIDEIKKELHRLYPISYGKAVEELERRQRADSYDIDFEARLKEIHEMPEELW